MYLPMDKSLESLGKRVARQAQKGWEVPYKVKTASMDDKTASMNRLLEG